MPEVISLLSSSDRGSPSPLPKRTRPFSPKPATTVARSGGLGPAQTSRFNSNPRVSVQRDDDIWTFSDDDDITAPPSRGLQSQSVSAPSPKRRRLDYDIESISSSLRLPGRSSPFTTKSPSRVPDTRAGNIQIKATAPVIVLDDIDSFTSSPPRRSVLPSRPAASWDPISSSARLPAPPNDGPSNSSHSIRRTQSAVVNVESSDRGDSDDDDFPDIADLTSLKHKIAVLTNPPPRLPASQPTRKTTSNGTRQPTSTAPKKTAEEKEREREERERQGEEKAAARESEKERKRLEKERAKHEKVQEKARAAALAEVNKLRTDKKVSTPEMIVDLPSTLDAGVRIQTETLLRELEVTSTIWSSPVDNVVRWRRKVRARFNDELGYWEPIPETIERENYAMVVVTATDFVELAVGGGSDERQPFTLEAHALLMKQHFPNDSIIYLIEGLEPWLRRNRNLRNRQFVSAVRSGLEQQQQPDNALPPASSQRRRRPAANPQTYIDEDLIDQALLQLQLLHNFLIHHTAAPIETARWLTIFTQHISTVPYRRQRDASTDAAGVGFCMESGQVRAGDSPRDTYIRVLQEIGRVTAPVAYGLANEFPTLPRLVKALEAGGPLAIEGVRRGVNKEGDVGERTVGQAVSRRMWKIFLGRDEGSLDI